MLNPSRQLLFALLLGLAWVLISAQLLFQLWGQTAVTLNDTDDAMRLVEMRAFLAGNGWFDMHLPRVQPPFGLDSHWSRLIDAGLAGVYVVFGAFVEASLAERLMRAVWPLLWLIPALVGAAAIAWRIAGREAALIALLLATLGMPAFHQFQPGRIDHHNVQIALALLTVAATVWADRKRWAAAAAGALSALALAIGFEGLPIVLLCGAVFAARYAVDGSRALALRDYGLALAISLTALFAISVAPARWFISACDMIAFNNAVPAALGGLFLAALAPPFAPSWRARWVLVIVAGALAMTLLASLEPLCLGGPFALMDRAIWPIWLAHVNEMQPLAAIARQDPVTGAWLASFPIVAVVALAVLMRDKALRRDFGFLTAGLAFLIAVATMLGTVKGAPYAVWLGMPLVAAMALHVTRALRLTSLLGRFAVGMLLTPTAVAALAVGIVSVAGLRTISAKERAEQRACFDNATYASLARLPPGLVAAEVDYGPFMLALTPHSVVAAPYHRLSVGIMAAHQAFAEPPAVARDILTRFHVAYVVTCGSRPPIGLDDEQRAASLWGQLQAGNVPDWLEPLPTGDQPLRIYRFAGVQLACIGQPPTLSSALTSAPIQPVGVSPITP